jgi:hypothetical protein
MIGRLVVLLLLANLAWFAWAQGWLRVLGMEPAVQAEPQRLERQIRPEALTLQPLDETEPAAAPAAAAALPPLPRPAEASPAPAEAPPQAPDAPAAASAPVVPDVGAPGGVCLQAGAFTEQQVDTLRQAAASLPPGSWRIDPVQLRGRWMVYVGKLADAEAVRAKRNELRELGVDTDRPGAALEPGLSLGRFASEESANRALAELGRKGVRSARVVQERRDTPAYLLRLPNADAALQQRVRGLGGALAGRELRACE